MGETFAILSMTLFAGANVMINRGAAGKSRSRGAFLSIVITAVFSALIWIALGIANGFPAINATGVAWFALAGLLTVFIGRVFLYASIQTLGAIRGSLVKRLNPFFSVLLGVLILNEAVSGRMGIGMLLIFSSFAVLAHQALRTEKEVEPLQRRGGAFLKLARLGYLWGPISAFAYASGYVARKQGLNAMSDAVFGTLVGAVTGAVLFISVALFADSYREDLKKTFTEFNGWLFAAGLLGTTGQICYFIALIHSNVSKIALITSMEVFVTIFLSWLVFRGNLKITGEVIVAATLGVAGTLLVIRY